MAIDPLIQAARRVELFAGLRPLQLSEIVRRAERVVFKPGTVIIEAGQAGDCAILVVAGETVRTEAPAGAITPERLPAGALLGEMAMLVETDYSSTVVARQTVKALRFTRTAIYDQMQQDRDLADHLVAQIARRLHALAAELKALDETLGPAGADVIPAPESETLPALSETAAQQIVTATH
jgi:CRP-like cAMP-binding protein